MNSDYRSKSYARPPFVTASLIALAAVGCGAHDETPSGGEAITASDGETVASVDQAITTPATHLRCACQPADGSPSFTGDLPCGSYDCDSGSAMISACSAVCGTGTLYQSMCIPSSTSWCAAPPRPNRDYVTCNCNDGFKYGTCVDGTAEVQHCKTQSENYAKCAQVCSTHGGVLFGNFTCTDNLAHCKFPRPDQVICDCNNGRSLTVCADYPGGAFDQFVGPAAAELSRVCSPICADLGGLKTARSGVQNQTSCTIP